MQRKAPVRCAAANDEDLGELFCNSREDGSKRARHNEPTQKEERTRTKEKAFAWMDSEDEEDNDAEVAEEEDLEEINIEQLDSVQSFGRMMVLAPSLQKKLDDNLSVPDMMAACRALARTKFFDGDILDELYKQLLRCLKADTLDVAQANDAIMSLATLNSYNKSVFCAVAASFKPKIDQIDVGTRTAWLDAFRTLGHSSDLDFLQMLERPPLAITNPSYKRVRCEHFSRGRCELGPLCTYAHDMKAPMSLMDHGREESWRRHSIMMTQDQRQLGRGAYGSSNAKY